MIVKYNDVFFDFLNNYINEFDVSYLKRDNPFLINYVFLVNNIPIGLISYSLIYDRIELEYVWVKQNFRRKGIASKLIKKMFEEKVSNITLEVSVSNESALNLYKKYGFKVASIRNNYYGKEDAYLMIREMM